MALDLHGPASRSLHRIEGASLSNTLNTKNGRSKTTIVHGAGLFLRRPRRQLTISFCDAMCTPAFPKSQLADFLYVPGTRRNALRRGRKQKLWVMQFSNIKQSPEIFEGNIRSSEENKGPPMLTIIAGLLVLLVVLWALGSLVSWLVGLLLKGRIS